MSKDYLKDISPENFERQGDESTPLFLVVQIRSRSVLDYHLLLRNALSNLDLFVHDHRVWYPKVRKHHFGLFFFNACNNIGIKRQSLLGSLR